ncbi:site-specific integrase [Cupriavidus sp. AcVe19-6a]|uniref:tyrosine-type recombinase/integrase n=1 Tax=Cupriavidus sp. AcVe19-6a TaxID=2821358 RepID=UPI001AEB4416|nr:site-specific integrase [Cupriavidus sp. AcVe19-6a]MBP0634873.1 site-specific integrase [Cupriavidus sp. AcVe19-6a]
MASIKLYNGLYRASISKTVNGEIVRRARAFPTEREARQWAEEIERQLMLGRDVSSTVRDVVTRYTKEISPKKKSGAGEVHRLNYFLKTFRQADQPIREIEPEHIKAWRDRRLQEVAPASVRRELNSIGNVFTYAVKEWHLIQTSPMARMKKPKDGPARTRLFEDGEAEAIFEHLNYSRDGRLSAPEHFVGAMLDLSLWTAMRRGELIKMEWSEVSLAKRVVLLPDTKNGSPRMVPLSREALTIMQNLHKQRDKGATHVFPLTTNQVTRIFAQVRDDLELEEDVIFHNARRTATTRFARKMDIQTLAKITGHKTLETLLNVYYQPTPADLVAALDGEDRYRLAEAA